MPSADSISFDTSGFTQAADDNGVRLWHSDEGDELHLMFFNLPPDIPVPLERMDDIRSFYRSIYVKNGLGLVECESAVVDGCAALRNIFKIPQKPHGMNYIGSITVPFRDFSFVVQSLCFEQGVTGVRDSIIFGEMLAEGQVKLGETVNDQTPLEGWWRDPYDASLQTPPLRNLSEDAKYNAQFPEHPLSRLRSTLQRLETSLRLALDVKSAPPFMGTNL